ncbi:MAG TPA: c-type cytochrome biogenesis protein CcsB [Sporichthya sp.]|nr:c-type cytochrome biogenesis protein CcsB [Sporichthya sp.]
MVHENLADASDRLVYAAILVYALAMLALCAEWAFSSRRFAAQEVETKALVGAGGPEALETSAAVPPARAERFGRIGLSLATLGFLLHLSGMACRGLAVHRVPWGNMYEFSSMSALAAMGAFLALTRKYDIRWLGVFVVTPVLLTLGLAVTVLYTDAEQLQPALQSYWLVIHVIAAVTSAGVFTVGAVLSVLYLVRERAERVHPGAPSRLPSADSLDRLAYRVHAFVFPLWTFAVIAGAIWAENAWGRYWGWDPKETWAFITWVVYAAYLHARATAGWKGRRAAAVALTGFGCFLFNYFVINLVVTGLHSYAGT